MDGVSSRPLDARSRLEAALAPELVTAIEQLVAERVEQALAEQVPAANGHGSPWLSVAEAAEYLRTSERTVQRLVKRSRVRSSTIGRRRLLHRDDLDSAATGEEKRQPLHPAAAEE